MPNGVSGNLRSRGLGLLVPWVPVVVGLLVLGADAAGFVDRRPDPAWHAARAGDTGDGDAWRESHAASTEAGRPSRAWVELPATVIAREPGNWARTVLVDRGEVHGVRTGMGVVSLGVAVGVVEETWGWTSRIRLVCDAASRIDARITGGVARGLVSGDGAGGCSMRRAWRGVPIVGGSVLETAGADPFPAGLRIGVVGRSADGGEPDVPVRPAFQVAEIVDVAIVSPRGASGRES